MAGSGSENQIPPRYLECLRTNFERSGFQTNEWNIISSILTESPPRDNIVITEPGYDVSICWQFPSVYLSRITLVVSSLKCEMRDNASNIKTCFLGEDQHDKRETFDDISNGVYNIVHVTPEFITSRLSPIENSFLVEIRDRITLIAITDAHYIYTSATDQWRRAYRQLNILKEALQLPNVPILAISPTMSQDCQVEIIRVLGLNNPQITRIMYIDRPHLSNLEYIVENGSQFNEIETNLAPYIESIGKDPSKNTSIVIFCITKAQSEEVAKVINRLGFGPICEYYDPWSNKAYRKRIEDDFNSNRIKVIVATNAFTLSSEKNDVRMVIHYQRPKNMEDYYNQVGFAGRDNLPAKCVMFFREEDTIKWAKLLKYKSVQNNKYHNDDIPSIPITTQQIEATLKPIADLAASSECRRRFIMNYFNQEIDLPRRATCCDNCRRALTEAGN